MSKQNMTVKEASERMEMSEQCLRIGLQQKSFSFGSAIHNKETDTWRYHISRASFWLYQYGYVPECLKEDYILENERMVS